MRRLFAALTCGSFAALLLAGTAWAGGRCAAEDAAPLKTAALQQHLMVAALVCHQVDAYNTFVLSHRTELQTSDNALLHYFQRNGGTAAYHAFKTLLANTSSLLSVHDPSFCATAGADFGAAGDSTKTIASVVADRPLPVEAGCTM